MSVWAWFGLFLILAIPGYVVQATVTAAIRRSRQARTWPTVQGTVTGGHVQTVSRRTGTRGFLGTRWIRSYRPVIAYTYVVGGQTYPGARYRFSWPGDWITNSQREADRIVGLYLSGQPVTVHHDPADPTQACLEINETEAGLKAVRIFGWVLLAAAAVMLVLGVATAVRAGRERLRIAAIGSSPAQLPVPTSQIRTALEDDLALACQSGNTMGAGLHVSYSGWHCSPASSDFVPLVNIYSRSEAPEITDMVWGLVDWPVQDRDLALLAGVASRSVSAVDADAASDWVLTTVPSLVQSGDQVETVISGVALQLRPESRLSLYIGDTL